MKLEILPEGIMGGDPIVIDASLVIVRLPDGTPVMVAGDYGPGGAVRAAHALDDDFNSTLRSLGIGQLVICDKLALPQPPPGAVLIRGPGQQYLKKEWPGG